MVSRCRCCLPQARVFSFFFEGPSFLHVDPFDFHKMLLEPPPCPSIWVLSGEIIFASFPAVMKGLFHKWREGGMEAVMALLKKQQEPSQIPSWSTSKYHKLQTEQKKGRYVPAGTQFEKRERIERRRFERRKGRETGSFLRSCSFPLLSSHS